MDWSTYWTIVLQVCLAFIILVVLAAIGAAAEQSIRETRRQRAMRGGHDDGRG